MKRRLPSRSLASNRAAGTARRLGLARPFLNRLPFTGCLSYAASLLPGGKWTFMDWLRLSSEECARVAVRRWDALSHYDQRRVSLNALCEAVGADSAALM